MASGATGLSTVIPPFVPSPSFGGGTTTTDQEETQQQPGVAPKTSSQPTGIQIPAENPEIEKQVSTELSTEPKLISLPNGGQGIYQPKKTDYVSYFENSGMGGDQDVLNLLKNIHSGIRSNNTNQPAYGNTSQIDLAGVDDLVSPPSEIRTPSQVEPSSPIGGEQTTALGTAIVGAPLTPSQVEPSSPIGGGENAVSGNTTTFGLQPNTVVNEDGTVDEKYYDPEDNGQTAFGYNSRDPNLRGISLPVDVIKQTIGDYTKDPKIYQAIKNGEYKVAITNPETGVTKIVNIVEAGPARWTGNIADATFRTQQDLGFSGKNASIVQIIGPDGANIALKGYQPGTSGKGSDVEVASKEEKPAEKTPEKPAEKTTEKTTEGGKMSDEESLARAMIVNRLKQMPGREKEDISLDSPEVTKLYNEQTSGNIAAEEYQEGGLVAPNSPGGIPEQRPVPPNPLAPPSAQMPFLTHIPGMESGGKIPGKGNNDSVPALLTPGEYVIPKEVVEKIGKEKLDELVRKVKAALKEKAHA